MKRNSSQMLRLLSVVAYSILQYGTVQWSRSTLGTCVAVVLNAVITLVYLQHPFVITMEITFLSVVQKSAPRMSILIRFRARGAGKSFEHFFATVFCSVPFLIYNCMPSYQRHSPCSTRGILSRWCPTRWLSLSLQALLSNAAPGRRASLAIKSSVDSRRT